MKTNSKEIPKQKPQEKKKHREGEMQGMKGREDDEPTRDTRGGKSTKILYSSKRIRIRIRNTLIIPGGNYFRYNSRYTSNK